MPLSLAALSAQTTDVTIEIEGEPLHIAWYPKRYSSDMVRQINQMDHMDNLTGDEALAALDAAAAVLVQLVAKWDFYEYMEEDGTPGPMVALEVERLKQCGLEVVWSILMTLLKEVRMGEAKGTPRKRR